MTKASRTQNSIRNSMIALVGHGVTTIFSFITRTIFINYLGVSYLGVNGLFSNILTVLSFAELGFGTAIIYALYEPIASKNEIKICQLMNYYAKTYKIIGSTIFILGLSITPFLNYFINDVSELPTNLPPLWIIYSLFIFNSSISYFFNYKRSIIIANQLGHIDSLNQLYANLSKNIGQIFVLTVFNSFIGYLIVQILCTFISNYYISKKAEKIFPYLQKNKNIELDYENKKSLKKNVLAMSFSKLGSVIISGVDNILISKFVGIIAIGYYSNYLLLTNTIKAVFTQIISPITASVGNYVVTKNNIECHEFFMKLYFINAYIAIIFSVCLSTLINPFIQLIWGDDYVFSTLLTNLIIFNFFLDRMRQTSQIFIDVKGLFWPIKWKSFIEGLINLSISLYLLLKLKLGIESVVIATIISNLLTNIWWEPYVVFKYGFKKNITIYYITFIKYTATLVLCYVICNYINSIFDNNLLGIFFMLLCALIVTNVIILIIYGRSTEFKYLINISISTISARK